MGKIKYLLKFGEKKYLQDLVDNKLYFANAISFWGIEDKLKIKGQGDRLEASTMMHAQKVLMQNPDTNEIIASWGTSKGLIRIEPAKRMPVYCLFAVYEDDCTIDSEGKLHITLSDEKKKTIREHFPKADGVVIIDNPDQFIEDVKNSIGHVMKNDEVHYYNIDEGYKTENSQVAMDMQYMMYVTQDAEPIRENGMVRYTFYEDYAYRILFCKDLFFEKEQEYRFILPEEQIDEGTKYDVKLSSDYGISDIEDVLG